MSYKERKIVDWSLVFKDEEGQDIFYEDEFKNYMNTLKQKVDAYQAALKYNKMDESVKEMIDDDEEKKTAVILAAINILDTASIESTGLKNKQIYQVVFKSCKYSHYPNYMSHIDGSETDTTKKEDQGEIELTHVLMCVLKDEVICIFEERRSGVAFGRVVSYMNRELKKHLEGSEKAYRIKERIIPEDKFIDEIDRAKRIKAAELIVGRRFFGTPEYEVSDLSDDTMRSEMYVTYKAERGKSIDSDFIKKCFYAIKPGSEITRMRVELSDSTGGKIVSSILSENQRKHTVNVDLQKNGVVLSESIFEKMLNELEAYMREKKS